MKRSSNRLCARRHVALGIRHRSINGEDLSEVFDEVFDEVADEVGERSTALARGTQHATPCNLEG